MTAGEFKQDAVFDASATAESNEFPLETNKYRDERKAYFNERVKTEGVATYPHKFNVTHRLTQFISQFSHFEKDQRSKDEVVAVAGRVTYKRASGAKLRFYGLTEDDQTIQIMASAADHEGDNFVAIHNAINRGDVVGFRGYPGRSRTGELSLMPLECVVLAPCFHMLPKQHQKVTDMEVRYRNRHLDLICNPENKEVFKIRNQVVQHVRQFMIDRDFVEVETPMMHPIHGGATARPFKTFHNDLDTDIYMRIAPELYLKKLVVAGLDRVFEIGKNFRNEGIDLTHNPEFTACEAYIAYADYYDWMNWTEELINSLVMKLHGKLQIPYHPEGPSGPEVIIDFTSPWPRVSYVGEIELQTGEVLPRPLTSPECVEKMKQILTRHNIAHPHPATSSKLLDELCAHFVEEKYGNNPFFIADHPEIMSPLAKYHRSLPEMTERCELFIMGKEVCNFYTELNDPFHQRKLFQQQVLDAKAGDDEAQPYDEDYCRTLEYGLPPTSGWGIGIDRLTMFMANKNNIKEVILFPAMRPQSAHEKQAMLEAAQGSDDEAPRADKKKPPKNAPPPPKSQDDVTRIRLTVGKIVEVWEHPDADKLWCEKIDIGNGEIRNIASGLREFYTKDEMINRLVVVISNLAEKPLRGFKSHGMVLCASNEDHTKVEFMTPPEGTPLGESLSFVGAAGDGPDEVLPKKKSPWDTCQKLFATAEDFSGVFKDMKLMASTGPVSCKSISKGTMS
eukprot:GHVH01000199.1.p1 GENE.GHVH01000199.1~~GHVH01000199.1.p1  ORF type:complete len:746 (+),score=121.52 GHVH01000199.1:40-2238(+)